MTAGTEHVRIPPVQEEPGEGGGGHDEGKWYGEKVDGDEGGDREGDEGRVVEGAASDAEDRFEDDRSDPVEEAGYRGYVRVGDRKEAQEE